MIEALKSRAVVERPIHELKPHDKNARTHSKRQIEQIAKSIKRFGFVNPVLLDKDGNILAGHGRIEAAKSLGLSTVPTLDIGSMSNADRRAYIVADNRLAELAGWDNELLGLELEAILQAMPDFDIGAIGFDDGELDALLSAGDEAAEEDQIPEFEAGKGAVTRPGDIWQLGNHRIMCCDARDQAALDLLMNGDRDVWYHEVRSKVSGDCEPEVMGAEDPLFILYTSGSTGKPKGVLHTTGGYLVWAAMTHHYVFNYSPGEVYWCAADIGWVTGHSYVVYGPLANGATTVMFEGVPNYPDHSRFWQIVDRHQVNIFYGAPTALRSLMREGDAWVKKTSRSSLHLLGSVGEPINPEAWEWYYHVVGEGRCPIVDTYWQTETGATMMTPLPGAHALKPGAASKPMFGVQPAIVDADGKVLDGATDGNLCMTDSWPGQMRTVWGDHERFFQTYFTTYPGKYFTGDGCRRDADGYYWITGRVDDVINVSGHRMGTAEVESALVAHAKVAEAAVVGFPHDIKGQGIYAYVTLNANEVETPEVRAELVKWVRHEIGPIATPDIIHFASGLPKTRSGKIMRRILRKIAEGDVSNLGDISTLADPSVVEMLVQSRSAPA